MYDCGNSVIPGEAAGVTHMANFIQWLGDARPNLVYFSNRIGSFAEEGERVPLSDKENRVIMLQWGPRYLLPQQSELLILAIGMADHDAATGFPQKPEVSVDRNFLNLMLGNED
jgi:hypothetical protein